ncbi:hypothetical protein CASFOL_006604 [Castilleja foliolosa]|uniref:Bifunctional inhibitor/plant lipid transfer protein/seed storage helical domain-containing protein n=1 Tax=Castilleja foliolosa TaxID=1961234 RepID=A0ABD3EAS1_9LAMI
MEISVKCICMIMGLLVAIYGGSFNCAHADKACPGSSVNKEAMKLFPCAQAAQDDKAKVSTDCCNVVRQLLKAPVCMCAVVLSDLAKAYGVNPAIAVTIPKRCDIANRPVGFKCGDYALP